MASAWHASGENVGGVNGDNEQSKFRGSLVGIGTWETPEVHSRMLDLGCYVHLWSQISGVGTGYNRSFMETLNVV